LKKYPLGGKRSGKDLDISIEKVCAFKACRDSVCCGPAVHTEKDVTSQQYMESEQTWSLDSKI
jgi:hypothetical protein